VKKKKESSVPVQQNQQKKLTLPQLRVKYPQFFRLSGSAQESKIALTFDDGPDNKYTPAILDVLRKYHVSATFFLLGVRSEANPVIVRRIVNEGHAIGNHSYNHANPAKLTEAQFENQFTHTQAILRKLIGYEPKLIRTPYGALQENQLRWIAKNGMIAVNWDIDSMDWKELNASQVLANILDHTHRGAIILQHSAGGENQDLSGTVKALPFLIDQLKKQGFQLVTVPELLHVPLAK
jgi:peptidoglycan/xylan/chitin deacetylase (PgdA/CDA1 family)